VGDSCTTKDAVPSPQIKRIYGPIAFTLLAVFGFALGAVVLRRERTIVVLLLKASKEIPKGRRAVVHIVQRRHVGDG
jgi:hypothetical protein